jgi:hypothetical protein
MKNVQLVIPELFLPPQVARDACADLQLPALEKFLARAQRMPLQAETLEAWLCAAFGVENLAVAALTLQADGVTAGEDYWLRADPVHIRLQREQMILQADVAPNAEEAAQLCASLNAHFASDGLRFLAPHPRRWYVQMANAPEVQTRPLAQVIGRNVQAHLPAGKDALHWHAVFNEIQMLLFAHAVNQAREERGELAINSVWLWGGGVAPAALLRPYAEVSGDSELAMAFAQAAGLPAVLLTDGAQMSVEAVNGEVLLVWEGLQAALQRGDLGAWRASLLRFEQSCMAPLLAELAAGKIGQITLDVPGEGAARRYRLSRAALWKLWRLPRPLAYY